MKFPRLKDKSGVLTSVLCLLLLVSYHASRDALITVLPSISACVNATLPPLEPQASYSHPLMAVQTRARNGSVTANLRDELYRYLRDTRGYEELEMDYPQKLRLERDVQAKVSFLQNLMVEKEVENDSENKGYVGMLGSVISTTERNLVDYQDLRIAERGVLGEKTKENRNYSADNVKIIEYIRKSLSGKGYNLHTSVVRELLNLQDELNAFRPFRDDLNDSLVSTNFSSEALNSTKISNLGSFSIPNTEFESSDVDGSGGRQFVVKTGIDADGSGGSQIVVEKAEVDGSGSGGTVDGGTIDRSAITKVNQAHFVSEEQLQKLMRLLDYIDVGHEKKMNPVFRAQDNVEEEPLVCEYYDFRGLMFMSNWPLAVQGSVLAGVHLTSIIGMFVGHYCVEGSTVQDSTVGAVFTLQMAVLLLVTDAVTSLGAVALVAIRAWQGLVQGACYPVVYSLLESKEVHNRFVLGIIFAGPWLGSMLGSTLGTQPYWAVVFYVSGAVVLVVAIMFIFLESTKIKPEVPCRWGEVMRRDVLVSSLMHGGAVWVLHTVLMSSTLVVQPDERWWVLLLVLLAGGLVAQLLDVIIEPAIPQPDKPARSHLLTTTVLSFTLTIASLMVLALEGTEKEVNMLLFVLVGGVVGASFGYGVASIGYREVLEAVEARRRSKALVITNVTGAAGASIACWLLFPMIQAGGNGGYITGCVFPLSAASGGAVCVFMFLLFPKTPDVCSESRPSDEGAEGDVPPDEVYVIPTPTGIPMTQTRAPPDGMSQRSVDNRSFRSIKSFKSAISSATFKTAVSGHRGTSFSTVYEDVADGMDMDEVSLECRSVALDSTDERQPHEGGLEQLEVKASYSDLLANGDRTSAWLQVHHNLDMPVSQSAGPHDPSVAPKPLPGLLF